MVNASIVKVSIHIK